MTDYETAAAVSFGAWIQQRRKALDLTQDELARRAGCSLSAIRKIESDERRPSRQVAELLAEHLRIAPDQREVFRRVARAELRVDRLPSPALGSQPALSKIPIPPTPLVGREPELAALGKLLLDPQCRLLTVIGPGGMGKTRLAIEAAARQQAAFPDGACFVSLASLGSADVLAPALADALGCPLQGQVEPRVQLIHYLHPKQMLIVLDNVEHLLEGVGLFAEVLERAPKVKLLVTSRERLNLAGEWAFEIHGLPVPPVDQIERIDEYSAVALFVQSARRSRAGFELKAEDRPAAANICRMVEGMPLGIELAAAWVSVLSCREIAREIEINLDFLATSLRDVPERQRSLRAAFDYSWKLLAAEECKVLSRLAIFRGGFTREAAQVIAGAALGSLSALVSKSLVRRVGSGRYDLHEAVRQYASSHLADDPEAERATRSRHSDFYLALLRDREKALKSAAQPETIRELTDELDNIRAAWAWTVMHKKFGALGPAVRCFGLLSNIRGWYNEGIEQLGLVAEALRSSPADEEQRKVLARALAQQGVLFFRQGRFDLAQSRLEESLTLLRPLGDPAPMTDPLIINGIITHLNGDIDRAHSLLAEGLACARAAGDEWFTAYAIFNQGFLASLVGRHVEGYDQMLTGLALWRALGDPSATAMGLNYISPTALQLGRHEEAQAFLRESLSLSTQVGDRWGMGTAYRILGRAALVQGDLGEAQLLIRKSLDIFAEFATGWDIVQSLVFLAEATVAARDFSEARRIYLNAIRLASEVRTVPLALDAMIGLAHLYSQIGECEQALELCLCVLGHAASTPETKGRAERLRAELVGQLTAQQAEAARSRSRSFEEVVAEILAVR